MDLLRKMDYPENKVTEILHRDFLWSGLTLGIAWCNGAGGGAEQMGWWLLVVGGAGAVWWVEQGLFGDGAGAVGGET